MVLTELEERVLKTIGKSNLLTKNELRNSINPHSNTAIDSATKSLLEKGIITSINPIGSTCFVLTKKGGKYLQEME